MFTGRALRDVLTRVPPRHAVFPVGVPIETLPKLTQSRLAVSRSAVLCPRNRYLDLPDVPSASLCDRCLLRLASPADESVWPAQFHHYQEWRRHRVNQLLRVQNFNVSRDGFGAGEHQSIERPFG